MTTPTASLVEALRIALVPVLSEGTWDDIASDHKRVNLAWRKDLGPGWGKPKYVARVLDELPADAVIQLATRCLDVFPDRCRIGVQDALWWIESKGTSEISVLTRHAIADALDGQVMHPREHPLDFIRRFAVQKGNWGPPRLGYDDNGQLCRDASSPIDFASIFGSTQNTPPEWTPYSHRELLDHFGFTNWPDKRVFQFLEALVDPSIRQGEDQASWVALLNGRIRTDGYVLREVRRLSSHPIFSVQRSDRGVSGRPKNLIFASTGPKPELGFRDAINNDIVILKGAETLLIYDDPLPDDGLVWDALVDWWARQRGDDPESAEVRRALGLRLRAATASEPERHLFDAYFRIFAPKLDGRLPALIPQVYLHFDPATAAMLRRRGDDQRFLNQRMDFLLLLPHRVRVVLEVDGKQHYADGEEPHMTPSPRRYAETARGDRELRLDGYEVYRFGGYELFTKERALETARAFFERLFDRHGPT